MTTAAERDVDATPAPAQHGTPAASSADSKQDNASSTVSGSTGGEVPNHGDGSTRRELQARAAGSATEHPAAGVATTAVGRATGGDNTALGPPRSQSGMFPEREAATTAATPGQPGQPQPYPSPNRVKRRGEAGEALAAAARVRAATTVRAVVEPGPHVYSLQHRHVVTLTVEPDIQLTTQRGASASPTRLASRGGARGGRTAPAGATWLAPGATHRPVTANTGRVHAGASPPSHMQLGGHGSGGAGHSGRGRARAKSATGHRRTTPRVRSGGGPPAPTRRSPSSPSAREVASPGGRPQSRPSASRSPPRRSSPRKSGAGGGAASGGGGSPVRGSPRRGRHRPRRSTGGEDRWTRLVTPPQQRKPSPVRASASRGTPREYLAIQAAATATPRHGDSAAGTAGNAAPLPVGNQAVGSSSSSIDASGSQPAMRAGSPSAGMRMPPGTGAGARAPVPGIDAEPVAYEHRALPTSIEPKKATPRQPNEAAALLKSLMLQATEESLAGPALVHGDDAGATELARLMGTSSSGGHNGDNNTRGDDRSPRMPQHGRSVSAAGVGSGARAGSHASPRPSTAATPRLLDPDGLLHNVDVAALEAAGLTREQLLSALSPGMGARRQPTTRGTLAHGHTDAPASMPSTAGIGGSVANVAGLDGGPPSLLAVLGRGGRHAAGRSGGYMTQHQADVVAALNDLAVTLTTMRDQEHQRAPTGNFPRRSTRLPSVQRAAFYQQQQQQDSTRKGRKGRKGAKGTKGKQRSKSRGGEPHTAPMRASSSEGGDTGGSGGQGGGAGDDARVASRTQVVQPPVPRAGFTGDSDRPWFSTQDGVRSYINLGDSATPRSVDVQSPPLGRFLRHTPVLSSARDKAPSVYDGAASTAADSAAPSIVDAVESQRDSDGSPDFHTAMTSGELSMQPALQSTDSARGVRSSPVPHTTSQADTWNAAGERAGTCVWACIQRAVYRGVGDGVVTDSDAMISWLLVVVVVAVRVRCRLSMEQRAWVTGPRQPRSLHSRRPTVTRDIATAPTCQAAWQATGPRPGHDRRRASRRAAATA